jgi:hypothetical protein
MSTETTIYEKPKRLRPLLVPRNVSWNSMAIRW